MTREICKICYNINRVGFSVSDKIWLEVVPREYFNKVVCLDCFTKLADEKLIRWDEDIKFYPVSFVTHSFSKTIYTYDVPEDYRKEKPYFHTHYFRKDKTCRCGATEIETRNLT